MTNAVRCRSGLLVCTAGLLGAACGEEPGPPLNDTSPALQVVAEVPIPPAYGIHDTFVRDGIAFVAAWNTGIILYDVGNGIADGSPSNPVELSRLQTGFANLGSSRAHNAWWFHNPNTGERRYLFVGQEGPGQLGVSSSGDIHIVDVSDLQAPVEVGSYRMDGTAAPAGTHNFWMDEDAEVLFAAYYNGGVVALDVSGTLSGNIASREIDRIAPAGAATYVWGIQLAGGSLYVTDMLNGLFQLGFSGGRFNRLTGGSPIVTERFTSDLWVHGDHVYTGTWSTRGEAVGNVVNIWRLVEAGGPSFVRQLVLDGIGTVGDVEVSRDGRILLVSAERGSEAGIQVFDLADPEDPVRLGSVPFEGGVHTATLADIDGRRYAFAAKNPPAPSLEIVEITP